MKQKDIALFIVIGVVSAIFSAIMSGWLITPSNIKKQSAETAEAITAEFNVPTSDSTYFNKDAINPTKLIQIGDNINQTPFNGGAN